METVGIFKTVPNFCQMYGFMGLAVAQLVEALRYKPEGCGFNSQ
jgi:hypothetical protein